MVRAACLSSKGSRIALAALVPIHLFTAEHTPDTYLLWCRLNSFSLSAVACCFSDDCSCSLSAANMVSSLACAFVPKWSKETLTENVLYRL